MKILLGTFFTECLLLILMAVMKRSYVSVDLCEKKECVTKYSRVIAFIFAFILIFVAGFRERFWDTTDYRLMYSEIGNDINNVFNDTVPRVEKGYLLFNYLLNLISSDSQFLLIVASLITNGLFIKTIFTETEDAPFSLFLYLVSGFLGTMNGLRQMLAAAVVFSYGVKWAKKEKSFINDIGMLLCILLMSTFHKSVLICIPIYFAARGKPFNGYIKIGMLFSAILFLIPSLSAWFIQILGGDDYGSYSQVNATQSVLRFLIESVPFLLCILCDYNKQLKTEELSKSSQWFINLSAIGFCFNLLALRMVYYARINMYITLCNTIMLPYFIRKFFKKGDYKVVKAVAIVLYIIYFYFGLIANGNFAYDFRLVI